MCPHANCGQTWPCPRTIIIVSTRLCVNLIGVNTSILNYCCQSEEKRDCLTTACSGITSSIPSEIFRNFKFPIKNKAAPIWLWSELLLLSIWPQSYLGTITWAQSCIGRNVSEHKRVMEQTSLCTNVWKYNRVRAKACIEALTIEWSPNRTNRILDVQVPSRTNS